MSLSSRFVILIHDHPFVHWDLLVQCGDVLRSWRLLECPARWQHDFTLSLPADAIGDHRLAYLDYEGPVSRERGRVVRWDHGSAVWLDDNPASVRLRLFGERLRGELVLISRSGTAQITATFFRSAEQSSTAASESF